jgi:hypothetical protein
MPFRVIGYDDVNDHSLITFNMHDEEPDVPETYAAIDWTSTNAASGTIDISSLQNAFVNSIAEYPVDDDPDYEAEYTDYVVNEPFEYGARYYVVMSSPLNYRYTEGEYYYSEREAAEFRLGRRVRPTLFGNENSFIITWVDEQGPVDDGYSIETEDELVDNSAISLRINTNIGRTVPLVSFEQEFVGNGEAVARKLHDAGLAYAGYVDGYHMSGGRDDEAFCYVETDSSCGYELVFSRLNMARAQTAESLSTAQRILKDLRSEGLIRISARCGFHVHVDVSDWGMKEIVSAYHLWNYLEDPIFRFASAFWGEHREEEVGGGYSTPIPKGYSGRRDIAHTLNDRRDSLNFSHILRAKSGCRCGASIYEDWANCSCNLNQPTLEFRVFNATMNPRKIKAYLAFCIAFVNKAKEIEHEPNNYPEMRWVGTHNKDMHENWVGKSRERIDYILDKFSLTTGEQEDIAYCFRNSSLKSAF